MYNAFACEIMPIDNKEDVSDAEELTRDIMALHKLVEKDAKSLDWHMKQPFGCLQEALYIRKRIFGY